MERRNQVSLVARSTLIEWRKATFESKKLFLSIDTQAFGEFHFYFLRPYEMELSSAYLTALTALVHDTRVKIEMQ